MRGHTEHGHVDPTFCRSPAEAVAAPPERLAYVAAYDPAGQANDAMAVIDVEESSASFGQVVGWSELPTAGNELHHFGWNACSSALCHPGQGGSLERRYLLVPGLRSSRTSVLDTRRIRATPRWPTRSPPRSWRPSRLLTAHTVHCGPGGASCSTWAGPTAMTAPAGSPWSTTTASRSSEPGSRSGASSTSAMTAGGTCTTTPSSPPNGRPRRWSSTAWTPRTCWAGGSATT
jgi:56kDa selenium binding protein (SBP56)